MATFQAILNSTYMWCVASVIAAAGVPYVGLLLVMTKTGIARGGPFEILTKGIERRSRNVAFLRSLGYFILFIKDQFSDLGFY